VGNKYLLLYIAPLKQTRLSEVKNNNKSLDWVLQMNQMGSERIPFIFILDYELNDTHIFKIDQIPNDIYYKFNDIKNYQLRGIKSKPLIFDKNPISEHIYKKAFLKLKSEIYFGNTFLANLTFPTEIETNYTLKELFDISHAKYKLYFKNKFIVSSPETFIQIKDGKVFTFPMKGTIDASIKDAANVILSDVKETAEHYTIVDLLRNDLSMIATQVVVNRFRYIDELKTTTNTLLQVSSEIEGTLSDDYACHLGDIFKTILPAGSITGAPKPKTQSIINEIEIDKRGYYTGVFGIFDGQNVDSAVMIRFIEQKNNKMIYRSGCGITHMSEMDTEYKEMIDKVYVPLGRKH